MRRVSARIACALVGAAAACTTYSDAPNATPPAVGEDAGPGAAPGADAAPTPTSDSAGPRIGDPAEAGAPIDAAERRADAAGATNLLTNGDFELGCAALTTNNVTVTQVADAHSGTHACMLCSQGGSNAYAYASLSWNVTVGEAYIGDLFLKAPADATKALQDPPAIQIGIDTASGQNEEEGPLVKTALPGATWARSTATYGVKRPASSALWFAIVLPSGNKDRCVLVDDALLQRN